MIFLPVEKYCEWLTNSVIIIIIIIIIIGGIAIEHC